MILVAPEKIKTYVEQGWWSEETMGELFIKTAEQQLQAMAVVDPPNRQDICGVAPLSWTWGQLLQQVGRYSALFHAQGLRKDDVIVMQLPNCVEMHAIYLACAITGVVVSPVPVQYRAHELTHVFATTQAKLGITTERVGNYLAAQQWAAHAHLFEGLQQIWSLGHDLPPGVMSLNQWLDSTLPWSASQLRQHMQDEGVTAHDVLTICWTSGTEARSKGVPRNHNEWLIAGQSVSQAGQLQWGAQLLIPFPFVNMAGVSSSLAAWLLVGGTLHHHHPFDLDVFVGQLRAHPMDYSVAAPAVLNLLLKQPEKMAGVDLSRLKSVGSGGGPLSEWMMEEMKNRFDIEVVNYFGSNEGAALSSSPLDMPESKQRALYFPRMGVPGFTWKMAVAQKIQTRLVDIDTGEDIHETGRIGELRFKGPTIFSGYYKAPELTERAFDAQGFYRTGDLFEIAGVASQFYRFAGRHKDIVIRGGMNISSEEIEGLLLSHPQVRDAAVIGLPDPVMGERVCAVVVSQAGQDLTLQNLVDYLKNIQEVAAFKWPERLILLDELPRNPVGKILKRQLRERFAAEPVESASVAGGVA
ncbi:short-chain-fatty-acid--CoA ligase [Limnohabitans sp. T6-5]|uniref:class I adenylate-forming enzyme family protein n=1 Tax=Limnohabitans sp. T6-5 TaxID=1100724 RepID=UPI000D38968D|nr:class I adenylate-forming enzyme family protein [Limnohabitans sp. T6-5]PUE11122.1 short-chain-fatty-acid--CoA ligase [Limnohabitans sp. T6-5]